MCSQPGTCSHRSVSLRLSAADAVFPDVFADGQQPFGDEAKAAMLYVVGPKGEKCKGPKGQDTGESHARYKARLPKDQYLAFVERLSRRSLEAVATYNRDWAGAAQVEEVRWCLVGGGKYCHGN